MLTMVDDQVRAAGDARLRGEAVGGDPQVRSRPPRDVGGELVEDGLTGRLIPPGDAAMLAQAISSALADPAATRNEALTLRARVQAEFSAEVMADGVLAAYREVLASPGL